MGLDCCIRISSRPPRETVEELLGLDCGAGEKVTPKMRKGKVGRENFFPIFSPVLKRKLFLWVPSFFFHSIFFLFHFLLTTKQKKILFSLLFSLHLFLSPSFSPQLNRGLMFSNEWILSGYLSLR